MKTILGGLLLLCTMWAHAADTMTMNVDASSSQFTVTLPGNPTTGYQWTATKYDKKCFKLMNSQYVAPKTKLIGAGGQMTFTFAPTKGKFYPLSTKMLFTYARPWEPKSGTQKQVTVYFKKK